MRRKYVFIDLDGTIIDHKTYTIPESTKIALKKAQQNGHEIIINTGRPPCLFYGVEKELGVDTYIAANGCIVVHHGETIYNDPLDRDLVKRLVALAHDQEIDIAFENEDEFVINSTYGDLYIKFCEYFHLEIPLLKPNYHLSNDVYQIAMFYQKDDYKKFEDQFPELTFNISNEFGLDVNSKKGMKEVGMKFLVDYLQIDKEDIIAIGDGYNDISMIKYAGIGVAMGNGRDEIKEAADIIADDIGNDGIYKLFVELKLIEKE